MRRSSLRARELGPTPPPTTSSDLTATENGQAPRRVHDTRAPRPWQQREIVRQEQATAVLNTMNQMVERLGGILSLISAVPEGDVLAHMVQQIPANGVLVRGWKQNAAAVTISNYSPLSVTATTQSQQGQAPGVGSGVAIVPAFIERTVALRGTAVVIYGQPGTLVELVAWVRPRPPHAAPCSIGPAGAAVVPAGTTVSDTVTLSGVGGQYLEVVTNVSAISAGSVQVTVNGITPSGYLYQLAQGAAIVAPGTQALAIGPALAANIVVPSTVQIAAVVTTGPAAYGVDLVAS